MARLDPRDPAPTEPTYRDTRRRSARSLKYDQRQNLYLVRYTRTRERDHWLYHPDLPDIDASWTAVSLRPSNDKLGWGLVNVADDVNWADTDRLIRLGDDSDDTSLTAKTTLSRELGLDTGDGTRLGRRITELLINGDKNDAGLWNPLRAGKDGIFRVVAGVELDSMALIRGGAVETDDFNRSDDPSPTAGWDQFGSPSGAWGVVSNTLRMSNAESYIQFETEGPSADDDMGVQALFSDDGGGDFEFAVCTRMESAATSGPECYMAFCADSNGPHKHAIRYTDSAGDRNMVTSYEEPVPAEGFVIRLESSAGDVHTSFIDGVQEHSATDTNGPSGATWSYGGLYGWTGGSETIIVDDFAIGDELTDPGLILAQSASGWWDSKDITSTTQQTLAEHNNGGNTIQRGPTTGSEGDDPAFAIGGPITHTGTSTGDYMELNETLKPDFTNTTGEDSMVLVFKYEFFRAEWGVVAKWQDDLSGPVLWWNDTGGPSANGGLEVFYQDNVFAEGGLNPTDDITVVTLTFDDGTMKMMQDAGAVDSTVFSGEANSTWTGPGLTGFTDDFGYGGVDMDLYAILLFEDRVLTEAEHDDLTSFLYTYYGSGSEATPAVVELGFEVPAPTISFGATASPATVDLGFEVVGETAPAVVATSSGDLDGYVQTLTVTLPTSNPGELLVVAIANSDAAGLGDFTTPTGWTLFDEQIVGGGNFLTGFVYTKEAEAGDSGDSVDWVSTGFNAYTWAAAAILDADTSDVSAYDQSNNQDGDYSDTDLDFPALTSSDNDIVLRLGISGDETLTDPSWGTIEETAPQDNNDPRAVWIITDDDQSLGAETATLSGFNPDLAWTIAIPQNRPTVEFGAGASPATVELGFDVGADVATVEGQTFTLGDGTSFGVTGPSTVNVDDLLVAFFATDETQTTVTGSTTGSFSTIPSGWTEIEAGVPKSAGGDTSAYAFYKVAVSGDTTGLPQTYTFGADDFNGAGHVVRITGVDSAAPIADTSVAVTASGQTSIPLTTVTTAEADSVLLAMVGADESSDSTPYWADPPISGWTALYGSSSVDNAHGNGFVMTGLTYTKQAAAGASGTKTASVDVTNDALVGFLLAITPDPRLAPTLGFGTTANPAVVELGFDVPAPSPENDGAASPAVVEVGFETPAPTITNFSTASPAVVEQVVEVPGPAIGFGATASPATVDLGFEVPAPSIEFGAGTSPATIELGSEVPDPTTSSGSTVSPTVVELGVEVPAPTVTNDGTASPSVVEVTAEVPAPSITNFSTTSPGTLEIGVEVPGPFITHDGQAEPPVVDLDAEVPAPTGKIGHYSNPSTVELDVEIPAATIGFGATATPATVELGFEVPIATGSSDNIAAPATITLTATVEAPSPANDGTVTAAVVELDVEVPAPTIDNFSTASPAVVEVATEVPGVTATNFSTVSPATVDLAIEIPAPSAGSNTTASPATVELGFEVPAPTLDTGTIATPATVTLAATVESPSPTAGSVATPATITLAAEVVQPTVGGETFLLWVTVLTRRSKFGSIRPLASAVGTVVPKVYVGALEE